MKRIKTDWKAKMVDKSKRVKVVPINSKLARKWGVKEGDTVVIPTPLEVKSLMEKVPFGKCTTINEMRFHFAKKYHGTIGCPITTGIFSWIVAHAVEKEKSEGKKRITPWWRTLKSNGEINPKYPGGGRLQKKYLANEGFTFKRKGEKFYIFELEKKLYSFL